MKKKIFLFLLIISTASAFAQREADAMFFRGCPGFPVCWCSPPFQGNVFWFNEDSLQQIIDPACLQITRAFSGAAFSDRYTGELLFASNGWRLVNGQGDVLAHKLWLDDIPHPGDSPDTTTVNVIAGPLFLNDPGDSTRAYLFYGQQSAPFLQGQYSMVADIYFTYALLDIPTQSIISKNNIVLSDTSSSGDMQACRHANGRDWWIIKPHMYTDFYYIGLFDPTGIEMNLVQLPDVPHLLRTNSVSKFNIQGNKYIQYSGQPHQLVHEYDFDRCEGILSNLIVHDISDSVANNDILSAISISPDGSKFYFNRNTSAPIVSGFYQYDLTNDEMNLISRFVSTPQMMPNGKKMLFGEYFFDENNVIQRRVSEITNPNAPFDELEIIQFKYNTPNAMLAIAPSNFAYFRLGAEAGSACDTLGLVSIGHSLPEVKQGMLVFPNPNAGQLSVRFNQVNGVVNYQLVSYLGQIVKRWGSADALQSIDLSALNLNSGLYIIQAQSDDGKMHLQKFVYQNN